MQDKLIKKIILMVGIIAVLGVASSSVVISSPASAQKGPDFIPGKGEVVGVFGKIPGQDLIVHVLVLVPHGADKNEVASEALRNQGAVPWVHDEFSTNFVWDQFSDSDPDNNRVTQNYNPQNDPDGSSTALTNTLNSWNDVATSSFVFDFGGTTDRCPSLVRECQGPQFFDTFNDVAWLGLTGCCTLGVTWFGTSTDEADMALNLDFDWATVEEDGFDIETVFLHENGHVVGLGHSNIREAVMYPSIQGVRQELHQDDKDGIAFLYPADVDNSPTVSITTPLNDATVKATIDVSADASDDKGVTQVEFFVDGVSIVDTTAPYSISWDTTTVVDGPYMVKATATDTIGQTASDSIDVTVDNTVPTVSITSPAADDMVQGTIDIMASAADATSGVTQVEFFVDGASIDVDTTAPYSISWDTTTVTNGNHVLTVNAVDGAGNTNTSVSVVVAVNNTVPSLTTSLTFSQEVKGKSGSANLFVGVTVSGSSGQIVTVDLELFKSSDGISWTSVGTGLGQLNGDGTITFKYNKAQCGMQYRADITASTTSGNSALSGIHLVVC